MTWPRHFLWTGLAIGIGALSAVVVFGRVELSPTGAPNFAVPKGWPSPKYDFKNNPVTTAGFVLGRKLFYDAQLSRDGSVSCGSCHQQFAAFSQLDHPVSHGIGGVNGKRNAPGLFNLAWQPQLMWDGAATHLETQPILPISNPLEMGESLADIIEKLKADKSYSPLFEQAFGTPAVDSQRVLRALAQFTGSLVSNHSRYDAYVAGKEKLSADEIAGLEVFRDHCSSCHREPLFTDFSYRSNGLDSVSVDVGRGGVTADPRDRGLFRVPSLRNVALTSPYMHDGRYSTLEQVLDHYDHGIVESPVLDPLLVKGIALSAQQRRELLSFLNTLSDQKFVHDVRFANIDASKSRHSALTQAALGLLGNVGLNDADAHEEHEGTLLPPAHSHAPVGLGQVRLDLQAGNVELVLVHELGDLVIYADDFDSNAPLRGLDLAVHVGNQLLHASEDGDGIYRIPAEGLNFTQSQVINLTVQGSGLNNQVEGTLPAESYVTASSIHGKNDFLLVVVPTVFGVALVISLFIKHRRERLP